MAVKFVFDEVHLPVQTLRPGQLASVRFTPQEGPIEAQAFGVDIGVVTPGRPGGGPGGVGNKPGQDPDPQGGPGSGGVVIKQDVRITVTLLPPASTGGAKAKTFVIRDAVGGEPQEPLELGACPEQAARAWQCTFRNAGRRDVRASGTVRFVERRIEEPEEEPPAEVSVGRQAFFPATFLRPGDPATLAFVPEAGVIEVSVFGAEVQPGRPTGKPEPDPQPGGGDVAIRQDVSVDVALVAPGADGAVATGRFRSRELLGTDTPTRPVVRHAVPAEQAGREWRCRLRNAGRSDIRCSATVTFLGARLRDDLPLRVLNNGLRQLIAAVGVRVRLQGDLAFVEVSDELRRFADGALGPGAPVSVGGDGLVTAEFEDVNLSAFGIRARTDTGRPSLSAFARFEARGEEIDELRFVGLDVADVDVTRLALRVDVVLQVVGAPGARRLLPLVTFEIDAEAFADALSFVGVDVSDIAVGKVRTKVEEVVLSDAFRDAVARYVTAGLVQLVAPGHRFDDLFVEADRWVVLVDPGADGSSGPVQPPNVRFPRPPDVMPLEPDATARAGLARIDQIVVLMQENRSFDHLLGYLSHPDHGLGRLRAEGRDIPDGLQGGESNPPLHGGRPVAMQAYDAEVALLGRTVAATAVPFGPHHEHDHVLRQMSGGAMSGFAADFMERYPNVDPQFAMSYYRERDLPVHDALAAAYAVCDRWFCSLPGPTHPNRFCTLSGHTPVLDNFGLDDPILGHLQMPTVFDVLSEAGVDWTYYEGDIAFLRMYDRYRLDDRHVIPFGDPIDGFARRAQLGLLPPVTFIDPNFADVPPAAEADDDHAPADLALGQRLVRRIYDALAGSPRWAVGDAGTLLVITYDEHGGFYDHVPPPGTPTSESPGAVPPVHPDGPTAFGPRVPTFVISPFVEPGTVDHTVYDHTSLLATILHRFVGEVPVEFGPRPALAPTVGGLLRRDAPRRPPPIRRTATPTRRGRFAPSSHDPHDFHATMRSLAVPTTR